MRGGFLGSSCFLAFLLSVSKAEISEDLRSGLLQEDDSASNADGYNSNSMEVENSNERAAYGSILSGFNTKLYPNNPYVVHSSAHSSPYNPFGYSQSFGSSYGESDAFSQALGSGLGSSYASEADANTQALAELSLYGTPYNSGYYGGGSSFTQNQAETHANANSVGWGGFGSYAVGPETSISFAQSGDQTLASELGSNYVSSDTIAQAMASGLGGYETYGHGLFGSSSQGQVHGNFQTQPFLSSLNTGFTSAEANAHAQASGLGSFASGSQFNSNSFGYGLSSTENSNLITSNFESGLTFADAQSQVLGGSYSPINSAFGFGGQNTINIANAFADANSRLIPPEEYIMPHIIPGGENMSICSKEGELHNVWSFGYECLICACVSQYGFLTPVCVKCDVCLTPMSIPPLPVPIPPIPPISPPTPEPQVSCDPLPTNTPFQNPLNPCQICICQYSFGFKSDVTIACEENPSCVLPSDLIIPPTLDPPAPVILPLCEKFPPNVAFPHPVDICQTCECIVSYINLAPQHHIVCYPKPECESLPLPLPSPTTPPSSELLPWPPTIPPGPLPGPSPHKSCQPYPPNQQFQHPWDDCQICVCNEIYSIGIVNIEVNCFTNPACCATGFYPSNQPQVIHEPYPVPVREPVAVPVGVVVDRPVPVPQPVPVPKPVPVPQPVSQPYPVEVLTPVAVPKPVPQPYPVPVRDPVPVLVPQPVPHPVPVVQTVPVPRPIPVDRPVPILQPVPVPHPVPVPEAVPIPVPQSLSVIIQPTKYLDIACKAKESGEEFMYNSCRICTCQVFGNLVVPICRRPNRPECVIMPAAVPVGSIVYIEPRCRYRPPLETFTSECQSCKCQAVFSYIMATCVPIPGCGQTYYGGAGLDAASMASSQIGSSFGHSYGFGGSQSAAESNTAFTGSSGFSAYPYVSGYSGSSFADESSANIQSSSNSYNLSPYSNSYVYGGQAQANEVNGLTGFHTSLYPKQYGQVISVYEPGGVFGQSLSLAEAIAQGSASTLGLQGSGVFGGRPLIKSGDPQLEDIEEKQ